LLQIGHQRRSNPRYLHATKMIGNDKILGRMTAINGQWNRPVMEPLGWPQKFTMTDEQLKKWGYENMNQFVNWRWYKKYAGGPIIDLGSHQIDVYNWYTGVPPKSVVASGGTDYYKDGREWYDNVMCIYENPAAAGTVRAFYQVLNTTSHGGFYETFMGDEGSLEISEDQKVGHMFREVRAKKREWEDLSEKVDKLGKDALELKIGETRTASGAKPPEVMKAEADMKKPEHQPHVENFVYAIRGKEKLNCPGEVGFETCVTTLKVNDAIEQKRAIEFKPEEFKA
jgi:predicted dehydrogenase